MLNFIRWLLVIPAAIGGWCLAFVLGMLAYSGMETLCPPDLGYPGGAPLCGPWLMPATMTFGSSLAALFVVTFTTLIAPTNRRMVAWSAYFSGASIATFIYLQNQSDFVLPFAGSIIVGFLAAIFMQSIKPKSRYGELR